MTENAKGEYDVIVVGGGPAGVGAGLAAARRGMRTLVIEQFNCLGGVATAGGHGHMSKYDDGAGTRVVGGIPFEVAERIVRGGIGSGDTNGVYFEVEALKLLYDRMAQEAGLESLFHTFYCEPVVSSGEIRGVVVQNKGGRQSILAKRVIDATGDGDVAFSSGCPWEMGRVGDGACQPVTLMFTIGGVDWPKVAAWRTDYPMTHVWEQAQRNGDMEPFQKTIMGFWWTPTRPDQVGINFTHVVRVDATKAAQLTAATIEARRQAFHCIDVFRKYVPGMERCHMVSTPSTIGIRESRRILGDYVLTEDDVTAQREFPDAIGYGSFYIDIHCLDGPGMDKSVWRPKPPFRYQIPYRILVPRGIENLLTAGRCVSCTHVALGSLRVMVQCMAMGEAAGTAAALSIAGGTTPRALDVAALRAELRRAGAIVGPEDIARCAIEPWNWRVASA
jgi:hypothetical protein